MTQLRFSTAGESHGKALVGIIEGMPSNLKIDRSKIDHELKRRQQGYGRGDRMKIESDQIEILSGIRSSHTIGSPISLMIRNKDWPNWKDRLSIWDDTKTQPLTIPRPGHADFAGSIKYDHYDIRNVLERASARETAMRVAIGAIMKQFLEEFGISIGSHVIQIHKISTNKTFRNLSEKITEQTETDIKALIQRAEKSKVRCADPETETKMKKAIDQAKSDGDSVGGSFECIALHVPVGLGSHVTWDRRLDAQITVDLMSIPAIKSVGIGIGEANAERLGSEVHDPFEMDESKHIQRPSNRAGGIEGGISNGQPIIVRAVMKPIPTLTKPLPSVDLKTMKPVAAHKERSDVCAVPAASIVGEAMLAISLVRAFCDKYGGDSIDQIRQQFSTDG
jgi:chorismate synthase